MKEINKNNIDQWMFDYVEGTLDDSSKQVFEKFISENPVYKEELHLWQQSFLGNENIYFPDKDALLRKVGFWNSIYFKIGLGFIAIILVFSTYLWMHNNTSTIELPRENEPNIENMGTEQNNDNEELFTDSFEAKNYDFKIVAKVTKKVSSVKNTIHEQETSAEAIQESETIKPEETIEEQEISQNEGQTINQEIAIEEPIKKKAFYTKADKMPRYPGGHVALFKYFDKHLDYPKQAKKNKIEGNVLLKFIITKTGAIKDISIAKGIGAGCDEEAIKVLKKSGKWIPGKIKGEAVDVMIGVPFEFKLK